MKHELGQMRTQDSGAIVDCSSLGGLVGLQGRAAYRASKHGAIGEEIAASVVRLCSPGVSFMIGVTLLVDCGYTAR